MVAADRIGLAIGQDTIRAVGLSRGVVVWTGSAIFDDAAALEAAARELLLAAPRKRRRPRLVVAVGPSRCQTRRLSGIPVIDDDATVTGLVRENLSRFFLRNGIPLATGRAARGADGAWWAAAFEEPVLCALTAVARDTRMRLEGVVPALTLLPEAVKNAELVWRDGDLAVGVRYEGGRLAEVRRIAEPPPPHALELASGLAALGADAATYADAYGAVVTDDLRELPGVNPGAADRRASVPRWRLVSVGFVLLLSMVAALLAPVVETTRTIRRAERQVAELAQPAREGFAAEADLALFRSALAEFASLSRASAQPTSRLLAAVAGALPESTAVIGLRVDSAGGQLVVLANRAASVPSRLEATELFAAAEITGAITREVAGGRERERATIRFRQP